MRTSPATATSFRKSLRRPSAQYIVFCGVHFMAESADVLGTRRPAGDSARPERRLLDGRHGRDLARWRTAGKRLSALGLTDETDSADLYEFDRGHQGVLRRARRPGLHLVECARGLRVGLCARQADSVSARSAPGPQHRLCDGHSAGTRWWCGIRGQMQIGRAWRPDDGCAGGEPRDAVEGPLRGASALSARAMWTRCARSIRGSR